MLIVNAISIMVAFLTHFPELITLSNPYSADGLSFPGMHWADVGNEVLFTYLSLLFLFFLFHLLVIFKSTLILTRVFLKSTSISIKKRQLSLT